MNLTACVYLYHIALKCLRMQQTWLHREAIRSFLVHTGWNQGLFWLLGAGKHRLVPLDFKWSKSERKYHWHRERAGMPHLWISESRVEQGEGGCWQYIAVCCCTLTTLKDKRGDFWERFPRSFVESGVAYHIALLPTPALCFLLSALTHTPRRERPLKTFQLQHLVHLEIIKEGKRWISWSDQFSRSQWVPP